MMFVLLAAARSATATRFDRVRHGHLMVSCRPEQKKVGGLFFAAYLPTSCLPFTDGTAGPKKKTFIQARIA